MGGNINLWVGWHPTPPSMPILAEIILKFITMVNCQKFYHEGHCIDVVTSPFGRFAFMDNDPEAFELTEKEYELIKKEC